MRCSFFVSEIWPIVTEALPDVKFIITGSNMPDSFSQLSGKNIIVRGYVEIWERFLIIVGFPWHPCDTEREYKAKLLPA